jgi:hypothetical protein
VSNWVINFQGSQYPGDISPDVAGIAAAKRNGGKGYMMGKLPEVEIQFSSAYLLQV